MVEGFLEARTGAGTFVSGSIPDRHSEKADGKPHLLEMDGVGAGAGLSDRGQRITQLWGAIGRDQYRSNAFRPRLPALDTFPLDEWSRMITRRWRNMPSDMLTYRNPSGYEPLRDVLAEYLRERRGIQCEPGQIIIVSGTPQSISLVATVLLDRGDQVLMEDPGNPRAKATLMAADAEVVPVRLDDEGLDLAYGLRQAPKARLAYVTPAAQYPVGVSMSLARRLELLKWAQTSGGWIIEDDYGTEFATPGVPLAALAAFEAAERVVYTGTFNDVLFPALRLGYLVLPKTLIDSLLSARILIDRCPPLLGQVVLADFIADGKFERYVRELRGLYQRRAQKLRSAINRSFGTSLEPTATTAGTELLVWLPKGFDDREMSRMVAEQDVEAPPLSFYSSGALERSGFVLGFGAVNEQEIEISVRRMRAALPDL